ncbi:MAG TPA: hypothetical protein VFB78_07540 [Acidimicrobiales bacterium]|nr:hypothetical protein [Acidimicrobiales bacterium]
MDYAYAVLHGDPPQIFVADDIDVLHRVIALEIVAKTPSTFFASEVLADIRESLLDEEWGRATELWMRHFSDKRLDVYPSGLRVWTDATVAADVTNLELQFQPLFRDD